MKYLYSHINYVRKNITQQWVADVIANTNNRVQYHWIKLDDLEDRKLLKYEPILTALADLLKVKVLRFPKKLGFGIYVLGKEPLVCKYKQILKTIQSNVIKETRLAPGCLARALNAYRHHLKLQKEITREEVSEYEQLLLTFINETPSLKNKRAYKW